MNEKEIINKTENLICTLNEIQMIMDKQQREIEKIKEELIRQTNTKILNEKFIENDFVSKDKIREKIKEYENFEEKHIEYCTRNSKTYIRKCYIINDLQKLLEE